MFEAYVNGKNITPSEYNIEEREGKAQCPCDFCRDDEQYNPEMLFRNGAKIVDAGSKKPRRDHFMTKGNHHPECEASRYEYTYKETVKALKNGGYVLFNLDINENLTRTFNNETLNNIRNHSNQNERNIPVIDLERHIKWKSRHQGQYKAIAIHDTKAIMDTIKHIKKDYGEETLKRCFFHSGDFVVSHKNFDLRDQPEKLSTLFRAMAAQIEGSIMSPPLINEREEKWASALFPRLISITDIGKHFYHSVQGSAQIVKTKHGNQQLRHTVRLEDDDSKDTRDNLLNSKKASIVAIPYLEIEREYTARQQRTMHFMNWKIHSKRQIMSVANDPIEIDPKTQQMNWNFAKG